MEYKDFFDGFPIGAHVLENGIMIGKIDCHAVDFDGTKSIIVTTMDGEHVAIQEPASGSYVAKRICERAGCHEFCDVSQRRCPVHQQEFEDACDMYRNMRRGCTDNASLLSAINDFRSGRMRW